MESIPYSWIERLDLVKMSVLPKIICRFQSKSQYIFLSIEIGKLFQKFIRECKQIKNSKSIVKKMTMAAHLFLPDFKILYKVVLMKIMCHWNKCRQVNQ